MARLDERERQRQSRKKREPPVVTCTFGQPDACTGWGAEGLEGAVSRTGFRPEPMEIIGEIFENLDAQVRLSRTGLERQFRRLGAQSGPILEGGWRTRSPCHEPASGDKVLRFSKDSPRRSGSDVTNREEP